MPIQLISLLNTRANAEGSLQFINEAALDPYVFTRESYLQWRDNLASDGKTQANYDVDDLDNEPTSTPKESAQKSPPAVDTAKTHESIHSLNLEPVAPLSIDTPKSTDNNTIQRTKPTKKKESHLNKSNK